MSDSQLTTQAPAAPLDLDARGFLASFMTLAVVSGITIGTGRVVTTFYALAIGATSSQIGLIAAGEAFGKMVVTLPAGFLIFRFGARRVYSIATFGSMALSLAVPFMSHWYGVALMRGLVSLCVPFRVVSMNTSFLRRLKEIGNHKAGWYRGAMSLGTAFLGPAVGGFLVTRSNYWVAYGFISVCFATMAIFSRTFLPEEVDDGEAQRGSPLADIVHMLRNRRVGEACFIEFISSATNTLFTTYIIVLAVNSAGLSESQAIFLVSTQGLTSVLFLFVLGPALRAHWAHRLFYVAVPAAVLSLALLGLSHSFYLLEIGAVLLSVSTALVHLSNMVELGSAPFSKSKMSGLYNLSGMLGGFFGAACGASITAAALGLPDVFMVWIAVVILATVGCVMAHRRESTQLAAAEYSSQVVVPGNEPKVMSPEE